MDPTFALCRVDPAGSFNQRKYTVEDLNAMLPEAYQSTLPIPRGSLPETIVPQIVTGKVENLPPALVFDPDQYRRLQQAKSIFGDTRYLQSPEFRAATNPFEGVGRSVFMNRAGVKLANIDAVFNVTGHETGLVLTRVPGKFTFCDVAAGPGAFTQYIQYRRPDAYGWGMTLRAGKDLDWKLGEIQGIDRSGAQRSRGEIQGIDPTRFETIYGPDPNDNGDLYRYWRFFSDHVRQTQVDGVDLVTGDGGFDVETEGPSGYERQEFLSTRLLVCQILVALSVLRNGGSFVCKVFDTVTELSGQVIFLLSLCFDAVIFFKPASSRPANAERYIVAKNCRTLQDRRPVIDLLDQVNQAYTADESVLSVFPTQALPDTFVRWLAENNQLSIDRQQRLAEEVEAWLAGQRPEVQRYNLDKALLIWSIPDNPRKRDSMFRV